ncbi:guanylyl cyclase 1 isoform X2 [Jatropha curcas]|uniref:guanylyl cyclase 1 isoform X2 n=1 Tax=Jatropha curcas TaxID=180498 RepID=UPI0005FC2CAB|nr:guanylyl cyclase 1 isoform X2 [Jatropha curcas]
MWPLYCLLSKIFNVEEAEKNLNGSDENHVKAGECHLIEPSSSGRKFQDAVPCCSRFVEVPHISQMHSWDCGLACVLMVLNTIGINNCSIQALAELCCTTSIWTVDLAYLLQKFSVRFSYFTVTIGANPNYSAETFYKEQLPTDLVRVDMLFQKAREEGINIQCRSIDEKEISRLILSGKFIVIALVDQYKLSRTWVNDVILSSLNDSNSSYTDEFEIRDPASSRKSMRISSKCLEEARKSFGTDEDLLLISLEKR